MSTRRLTLQLTPLLDLLLIVIFAQYLDVGQRDRARADETERLSQDVAELNLRTQQQQASLDQAQQDARHARQSAEQLRRQTSLVAAAAAEALNVSPEELSAAMANAAEGTLSETERQDAIDRLREFSSQNEQSVVWQLLENAEMRKRVEIWRLHLRADGGVTFVAGDRTEDFRADAETITSGAFVDRLQQLSDRMPDAKGLVILALTYDERVYLSTLEPLREDLRAVVAKLSQNSRSRFHFADLGYQSFVPPEG